MTQTAAPILSLIPDIEINLQYWGLGGSPTVFGGKKIAAAAKWAADVLKLGGGNRTDQSRACRSAKLTTRTAATKWARQFNQAAHELDADRAADPHLADRRSRSRGTSLDTIKTQIADAKEVDELLHEKFTNEELYIWMQGEISRLYYEYYRFAFDTARKAERTMKQELMRPELDAQDFVKFNYWDGGRKGLMSGEALYLDVKRMEMAYHDNNKRELELTRDVSLRQLDPVALLTLRSAGHMRGDDSRMAVRSRLSRPLHAADQERCRLGRPGGRARDAACYCTLSLLRSSVRKAAVLKDGEYLAAGRRRRSLRRLHGRHPVDRHKQPDPRQRHVRDRSPRAPIPSVRGLGSGEHVEAGPSERLPGVRLRDPLPISCCTFASRPDRASIRRRSSLRSTTCFN